MSAPSHALFYYQGTITHKVFVNIGWCWDEIKFMELVVEALTDYNKTLGTQDFDYLEIYSHRLLIQDLIRWKKKEISHDELMHLSLIKDNQFTVT